MDGPRYIARRANLIDASGIRRVFDLAARLPDPINLSIGQPDFPVPEPIKQAAISAIQSDFNGYTVTQGIAELRERIAAGLQAEFDWSPAVLITSGVSGGLLLALMSCLDPGDEVIFLDPYFVMYKHLVNLVGGKPVMISAYPDFRFPAERIAAAVTSRTKLLLLNSPSNPTGVVMSDLECRAAAQIAREHELLIITDEIYHRLSYDGPCPSVVPYAKDRVLLLRGFSKTYAMTGWRLGYAAGPAWLIEQMTKLQQYTFVCAPSMVQRAGAVALTIDVGDHIADYRRKRDLVCDCLKDCFELVRPSGGFYVFPRAPDRFANATEFVEQAICNNVLIIPGSVFSEHDSHFRISYATSDQAIRDGCRILCGLAR
ncbi:MAG: pyridoxal phosphate-dependent aminotransferase [Phycisphaerae bacterium]